MVEKLKKLGFYTYSIKNINPLQGVLTLRKDGFGVGWEMILPYRPTNTILCSSYLKAEKTILYKYEGSKKELLFQVIEPISEEVVLNMVKASIDN